MNQDESLIIDEMYIRASKLVSNTEGDLKKQCIFYTANTMHRIDVTQKIKNNALQYFLLSFILASTRAWNQFYNQKKGLLDYINYYYYVLLSEGTNQINQFLPNVTSFFFSSRVSAVTEPTLLANLPPSLCSSHGSASYFINSVFAERTPISILTFFKILLSLVQNTQQQVQLGSLPRDKGDKASSISSNWIWSKIQGTFMDVSFQRDSHSHRFQSLIVIGRCLFDE
ncbi:hypothetical protein pb186bvf_005221 [Paramecium bursaria]